MHFVVDDSYHHIVTAFYQAFDGRITHTAGNYPVDTTGGSSPLDMTQYTDTGIGHRQTILYHFGHFTGAAEIISLRYNDEVHQFLASLFLQQRAYYLFNIGFTLGDQHFLRSGG